MWANPFIGCDFKNTDDDFIEKGMEAFASSGDRITLWVMFSFALGSGSVDSCEQP